MTLPSKRGVSLSLKAIRVAIIRNHMNMDSSAHGEALHAIWHCFMDEGLRCIQCDASTVRLWTVQDQLAAVKMLCTFFRLSPVNIDEGVSQPVVCACADALLSMPHVFPGFAYAIARAYCLKLVTVPPQSSLQISSMVAMLGRLK